MLGSRSTRARAVPEGGGSSTSRSFTSATTSWCPISPGGGANGCRRFPEEAYFTLAPDWVCEVLSPSTQKIDRSRKLRIYAEAGVAHAWLVDPIERTLEVLRLKDGAWSIVGVCVDSDVVRIHPFEAIQIELGRLWPDAPPTAPTPVPPDAR